MVDLPKDPWARVKTEHDLNADEVVSAFQKSIRRGLLENALLLAYEMYVTSAELEEHLWTRLSVISVESAVEIVSSFSDSVRMLARTCRESSATGTIALVASSRLLSECRSRA